MTEAPLKYPKSVFFIIGDEFCERFCYYGMRAILVMYLSDQLKFSETDAKITYHAFSMFVYFFPIIGGIVSDSWLGKFNTIFYLSILYTIGCVLMSAGAADPLKLPQKETTYLALFLISVGTGGIKPCVSAFGGDQFLLPQQAAELATFFSLFYFSINAGSLCSTFMTPILRNHVHCLGNQNCYPLAFGVPGVMMVVALIMFALGRPLYRISERRGNVLVNVVKCMSYALFHRSTENPGNHWLDRSVVKYGTQLVNDIKVLLKVLLLYIPLPIFWALFDQQGSGWTFQAVRMDGNCGFFTILPDQMQLANPLLVLVLIPVFTYFLYPALAKCHLLKTPLQRICCGGFVAAGAFGISSFLALALENTYPVLPSEGEAQIRIYDPTNCQYSYSTVGDVISGSAINGYYVDKSVKLANKMQEVSINFTSYSNVTDCKPREITLTLEEKKTYGIYINDDDEGFFEDNIKKSDDGYPLVRTITSNTSSGVTYTHIKRGESIIIKPGDFSLKSIRQLGELLVEGVKEKIEIKLGGTYTILINQNLQTVRTIIVTEPNSIHILWLLPQYLVITIAEVMFAITGLEFSYSEAPISMKAVLQACWLLNTSIGNLLVVVIESLGMFDLQSRNFLVYTVLMIATMVLFTFLAMNYKKVNIEEENPAQ